MNTIKLLKMTALSVCLISGLAACAQNPLTNLNQQSADANCSKLTHKKLQTAINQAQDALSNRSCHYQFDTLHQQLLNIAENDPAQENGSLFLKFYKWNVSEGVISTKQGKEFYNRYFKPSFGNVLSNDRNVCSLGANKEELVKNLGRELTYKKTGLQDIMQNRDAYFEAQRIHNELLFLIETTLMACDNT